MSNPDHKPEITPSCRDGVYCFMDGKGRIESSDAEMFRSLVQGVIAKRLEREAEKTLFNQDETVFPVNKLQLPLVLGIETIK